MGRVIETFTYGTQDDLTLESLLVLLERAYIDLARAVNTKPDVYERATDGLTTDVGLANGSININTSTLKIEMLAKHNDPAGPGLPPTVTWVQIS